jgi:hypothetical protein
MNSATAGCPETLQRRFTVARDELFGHICIARRSAVRTSGSARARAS